MRFPKLLGELLRYQIFGTVIAILEAVALFLLTDVLHIHYLFSNLLCFLLTTILHYLFSTHFVFYVSIHRQKVKEMAIWLGFSLLRLILCQFLLWIGTDGLRLHYMLTKGLTMLFSHFYNFFVQKQLLQKELF